MQIREYSLPPGWFPRDPNEVSLAVSGYLKGISVSAEGEVSGSPKGAAAIAPHAGWYYCGRLAARSFSFLNKDIETVAVIGGHLPANYPVLYAADIAVRTPFGPFPIDNDVRSLFLKEAKALKCGIDEDRYRDNTVEALLPMARFFFPEANLLWLRFPACKEAYEAGKLLSKTAKKLGKKIAAVGSTDLTHYGINYGFLPHGTGESALRWVKEVNDANFIKAVEKGDPKEVLMRAEEDSSSCSAGAVLGTMGFAAEEGANNARLLEYATSADVERGAIPDSFVGYASISFF